MTTLLCRFAVITFLAISCYLVGEFGACSFDYCCCSLPTEFGKLGVILVFPGTALYLIIRPLFPAAEFSQFRCLIDACFALYILCLLALGISAAYSGSLGEEIATILILTTVYAVLFVVIAIHTPVFSTKRPRTAPSQVGRNLL